MKQVCQVLLAGCVVLGLSGCVTESNSASSTPGKLGGQTAVDRVEAARVNTRLGIDYLRQGELERARDKLERALEQDDSQALTHTSIAFLYQTQGETDRAERHYRRAVQLAPRDADIRNNFGVFLCGQNRYDEALAMFDQAVSTPTYNTPQVALTNAGVCARKAGNDARGEELLRAALRAQDDFPDALLQLALLSYQRGDYLRARAFVQRHDAAAPATPGMLLLAVRTELALGAREAANDYGERLQRKFPQADETYEWLRLNNNG